MRASRAMALTALLVCCSADPHQDHGTIGKYSTGDASGQKQNNLDPSRLNLIREVRESPQLPSTVASPNEIKRDAVRPAIIYVDPKANKWILEDGRELFGITKCWTHNGVIHVLAPDGTYHQVASLVELEAIPNVPTPSSSILPASNVITPQNGKDVTGWSNINKTEKPDIPMDRIDLTLYPIGSYPPP